MPRFLHTADWQLGRQYSRFEPEDASLLAAARFDMVATLADLACEQKVDAVLVAGDVFDAQTLSDRSLHRTFQAMAGFTGPWLMLPGNHDAALAESIWTRAQRLQAVPTNVHLLLQAGITEFEELGFAALAAPLTQRQTYTDLTQWFDTADTADGLLRIGLAHGSVEGILADSIDSTNPIAADRAASARLDYLALGDWHGLKEINARTWYSGTPEQERFKNNGAGHALIIDIAHPGDTPKVTAHAVGRHHWVQRSYRLALTSDIDAMLAGLAQLPDNAVLDLTLDGQLDLAAYEQLQLALSALAGRHRSLQVHQATLHLQPTGDDIAALKADGYVGHVIDTLREQQQDEANLVATEALAILSGLLRERQQGGVA